MSIPEIIIPDPRAADVQREEQLRRWIEQLRDRDKEFVIENIRMDHDPEWRNRTLSITAARERKGIWLVVSWVFNLAQASFIGGYCYSLLRR